jgi:hypothetical protein
VIDRHTPRIAIAIAIAASFILGAPLGVPVTARAQLADSPWPTFQHDAQHTGRSPYTGPTLPGLKWTYEVGPYQSVAVGAGGTIYVGSCCAPSGDPSNGLYALNPDGTLQWSFPTSSYLSAPAVDVGGTIYVTSGFPDPQLYAVNADGTQKWVLPVGQWGLGGPMVGTDGTILLAEAGPGVGVRAVNPDGTLRWTFDAEARVTPAAGLDGTIYLAAESLESPEPRGGVVVALNPDGTLKWVSAGSYNGGNDFWSPPAVGADGTIYQWFWLLDDDANRKLYAINADGSVKWTFTTDPDEEVTGTALAADGSIYLSSWNGSGVVEGRVYALNPDGRLMFAFPLTGASRSSPVVGADGTVYVGANQTLFALQPDGSLKWSFTSEHCLFTSPVLAADGTLYVGGCDGGNLDGPLYAIGVPDPKTFTDTVGPGGTVSTDTGDTGATPSDPVQVTVTAPGGGTITITWTPNANDQPGFTILSGLTSIGAPDADDPSDPLVVTFELARSILPPRQGTDSIRAFKDGVDVPDCTGAPGEASPDPCVSSRTPLLETGNVRMSVLTTTASDWQLGVPAIIAPTPTTVSTGIAGMKLILVDKYASSAKAKAVFVSKDTTPGAIHNDGAADPSALSGTVEIFDKSDPTNVAIYDLAGPNWIVNKSTVAKYVFNGAGTATAGAKVVVVKPDRLLKVVGKNLGDSDAATGSQNGSDLDLSRLAVGDEVRVRVTMVNGSYESSLPSTHIMCSDFTVETAAPIGGTGYKITSKTSTAPGSCS